MGIMSPGRLVLASLSILTLAVAVSAVLVNHTIDDQSTLSPTFFTYIPSEGSWSAGQTCMTCPIHPGIINSTQVYDGTWTYTIYDPGDTRSIQATFNGTAVYVYNVLANRVPGAATFMNLSFSIDGIYRGQFIHIPDSSTTVLYNVSVFAADSLANSLHTLSITVQGQNSSHVMFDYLVYTTEELDPLSSNATSTTQTGSSHTSSPTSPTSSLPLHSTSVVPIVGGATGSIAMFLLAALLYFWLYRCRHPSHGAPLDPRRSTLGSSLGLFESRREGLGDRRLERAPASFTTQPHPQTSRPPAYPETSCSSQDVEYPRSLNFSITANPGTSSIGPRRSDRSDLVRPSDTDVIRAEIVQLREECERMIRDREADRMYLLHDPPPVYEERVVLIRRET